MEFGGNFFLIRIKFGIEVFVVGVGVYGGVEDGFDEEVVVWFEGVVVGVVE